MTIPSAQLLARCGGRDGLRRVLQALTVVEKLQPGRPVYATPRLLTAYRTRRRAGAVEFEFPVAAAAKLAAAGILARLPPPPAYRRVAWPEPTLPLYDYQEAIVRHFTADGGPMDALRRAAGTARTLLHLGTGLGKTLVALALGAATGGPALFVCERESQRRQLLDWAAELYPELRAAAYANASRAPPSAATHDIVAVIIDTARAKPPAFFAGYSAVFFDEADAYCTQRGCAPFWCRAPAAVALTATIAERSDGFDAVLPLFFGSPIAPADVPGCDVAALAFRGRVQVVRYRGHPDHAVTAKSERGTASAIGTVQNVYADRYRTRAVIGSVLALLRADLGAGAHSETGAVYARRFNVYVFTECRARLDTLRALLYELAGDALAGPGAIVAPELEPEVPPAPGPRARAGAGILRGGVVGADAARARQARVILLTYGYGRRGLSVDEMNAIVFDSSRRRGMMQLLGRIERRGSDSAIERRVVDFVDVGTVLQNQLPDRKDVYAAKGYAVETATVAWNDPTL